MIRSPGPWQVGPRVHEKMHYAVFDANGSLVVNLGDGWKGIAEQRGNAFAIGAVMDLLKAAQEAQEVLSIVAVTGRCAQGGEQRGNLEHAEVALGKLEAAIKKATTETPVVGVEKGKQKEPELIVAVVCEDGTIHADGGGHAVFPYSEGKRSEFGSAFQLAEEHRESIRCSGSSFCKCDDHRIVQYVPNV